MDQQPYWSVVCRSEYVLRLTVASLLPCFTSSGCRFDNPRRGIQHDKKLQVLKRPAIGR